jgi:hypothetical protein
MIDYNFNQNWEEILALRKLGYRGWKIAGIMNISTQRVYKILSLVRKREQKKLVIVLKEIIKKPAKQKIFIKTLLDTALEQNRPIQYNIFTNKMIIHPVGTKLPEFEDGWLTRDD